MKQFAGVGHIDPNNEIAAFVHAMTQNRETTCINLRGICLVADPVVYEQRTRYTEELQWTFQMASRHPGVVADLQGNEKLYHNLVPNLERLTYSLMHEFDEMNRRDIPAVLTWLVHLTPASWCKWALSRGQRDYIVSSLGAAEGEFSDWGAVSIDTPPAADPLADCRHQVLLGLVGLKHYNLSDAWLISARDRLAKLHHA